MNKLKFVIIVAIVTATFSSLAIAGAGNRVGTAGSTQLLIPVGPRGIAMGYTSITDSKGIDALFWNPANVAKYDGTSVTFSHMSYIADIGVEYGALGFSLGKMGSLALSIKSLSIGDIDVTTVDNPDGTGQSFRPQFVTTGITYSALLSDRIAIGVTANLNMEKLHLVSKTNVSFNAGISYLNLGNVNGLSLGIVLKNLGTQSTYDGTGLNLGTKDQIVGYERTGQQFYRIQAASEELPTTLELGLGYRYALNANNVLQVNGVFQNSNYYYDEYRLGLEYAFDDLLFIRGGYLFTPEIDDENAKQNTLTAGFGLKVGLGGNLNIMVDYGFQKRQLFDDSHVIGVTLAF
jgi:hypothetical protein